MKPWNSTLNRGTKQLSRAKAGNLKPSELKPKKWWNPTRKPMNRSSSPMKRHSHHKWVEMLDAVSRRAHGRCERCKRRIYRATATPANVHHVLARSACGTDDMTNLAYVCGPMNFYGGTDHSCHTWIHSNPKAARTEGWLK